jgi:hypothetical protein
MQVVTECYLSYWASKTRSFFNLPIQITYNIDLSRESGEEDQSAAGLLLRTYSAGPVSQTCFLQFKRRELLRAITLDDLTPQRRISELRVWSYEPFIVPASSSSGYLSGQNLEVVYIIRNSI